MRRRSYDGKYRVDDPKFLDRIMSKGNDTITVVLLKCGEAFPLEGNLLKMVMPLWDDNRSRRSGERG